jgi:hypothetical protein
MTKTFLLYCPVALHHHLLSAAIQGNQLLPQLKGLRMTGVARYHSVSKTLAIVWLPKKSIITLYITILAIRVDFGVFKLPSRNLLGEQQIQFFVGAPLEVVSFGS